MNLTVSPVTIRNLGVASALAVLAACATTPPPPPPPPPVVVIPPQPLPPSGATASMLIPQVGPDGIRQTVNAGISRTQRLWNLRSALNVAALNCLKPQHASILPAYAGFLDRYKTKLAQANRALDGEFRTRYGAGYRTYQDQYITQVYNYFALPPVTEAFCDAATGVAGELALVPAAEIENFADRALPQLEAVYENFFRAYEQYRVDLAAWNARYGQHQAMEAPTVVYVPTTNPDAQPVIGTTAAPAAGAAPTPPVVVVPVQAEPVFVPGTGAGAAPAPTPTPTPAPSPAPTTTITLPGTR